MNCILLKVVGYKSFTRKDGSIGQTVVALNDSGYRCNYDCVNKDSFDFSVLEKVKNKPVEFTVGEFHTRLIQAVSSDGSKFFMNVPSFRLVSCKLS